MTAAPPMIASGISSITAPLLGLSLPPDVLPEFSEETDALEVGSEDVSEEGGSDDVSEEVGSEDVSEEVGSEDVSEEAGSDDVSEEVGSELVESFRSPKTDITR